VELGKLGIEVNAQNHESSHLCLWRCDWWLPVHPCRRLPSKCSAEKCFVLAVTKADYRVIPWGRSLIQNSCWLDRAASQESVMGMIFTWSSRTLLRDRAQAEAATNGFAKNHYATNGQILGAHLVGSSGGVNSRNRFGNVA